MRKINNFSRNTKQSFRDWELIVVDNISCEDSLDDIHVFLKMNSLEEFVKLVSFGKNLGFAGGNWEGLKYAKGECIALLNPDTVADTNWLGEPVKAMETHSEGGICASRIIKIGTRVIDSAGDAYATSLKGFKRGEGSNAERFNQYEYAFGACAGTALYRETMIDEIGFCDQDFFNTLRDRFKPER